MSVHVIGPEAARRDAQAAMELHRRLEAVPVLHAQLSALRQMLDALMVTVGRQVCPELSPAEFVGRVLATRDEMIVAASITPET